MRQWRLDGVSVFVAFVAGFLVAAMLDDWWLAHHEVTFR